AAVAERFPGSLDEAVVRTRRRFGVNVITMGRSAVRGITDALKHNSVVALLCDLEQGPGVSVRFFGRKATVPGGPAAFALKTGADRKSTRLNSSHDQISYAVFCLKKKK